MKMDKKALNLIMIGEALFYQIKLRYIKDIIDSVKKK